MLANSRTASLSSYLYLAIYTIIHISSDIVCKPYCGKLVLTKGVEKVGDFFDAARNYFYILSIRPVLVNLSLYWIFLASHVGRVAARRSVQPSISPAFNQETVDWANADVIVLYL